MKITILHRGEPHACEVNEGESIASAANRIGINLYGSCLGQGTCCRCSWEVVEGVTHVLNLQTNRPALNEKSAPYARTCMTTPSEEDVVINANKNAWLR